MSDRAVYDTMIFFQWAVLPAEQQRRTIEALYDGSVRLCLSAELVREVRDVLTRPELVARFPALSIDRVDQVLREAAKHADFFPAVPAIYTWPRHPSDDHIFNLAIESQARFLVTWETRILSLATEASPEADQLRVLAPHLQIVSPPVFARAVRS